MPSSPFPADAVATWWIIERQNGPDSAFGPFADVDAAESFAAEDPIADDQVAADCLGEYVKSASLEDLAAVGVTDVWIVT
ncbi:hypothetical protein [Gordonia cholesterolivorans]|uniref:Uncharacterized protein n=1 Tax=Gordonia cholesterolivorans TaxID=559625 RepID=A0ABN3HCC5_9ACTN